ncbi:MAG: FAD-dependent monooxygenase [Hyphomicrobiales bacterium]|nr:FAD-dependent monooxygenase [Hyphomicrobiales bacterium]
MGPLETEPILIVGGGLGGLTAALALARRGIRSRVLEGGPEFGAIGYGIQFGPNVFHVFEALGLTEAVVAKADRPPAVLMRDALTGDELVRIPTGDSFRARFRYPYIIVHRIDVHNVLLDACRRTAEVELVPDAMVTDFEERDEGVTLATADGRTMIGSALLGADGLRSFVRARLLGDGDPRPVGYVAHRTIVPMVELKADVNREDVVLWAGPGFHIVHYPLRHGTLFNIVAVFRTATHGERGGVESYRAELQRTYRDAHPAMRELLAMMDLGRRWQVGDRDPVRHWTRGRVVLLGDAAHPPLQSFAQGACMAIEDGLCLAEAVHAEGGDHAAAFRRFEAARLLRTARLQLESRVLWGFYHAEGIEREVRNATVATWDEAHLHRCLAWLYDGFQGQNS